MLQWSMHCGAAMELDTSSTLMLADTCWRYSTYDLIIVGWLGLAPVDNVVVVVKMFKFAADA